MISFITSSKIRKKNMLVGLPILSNQQHINFRKFANLGLDQHEHVAYPMIPKWSLASKGVLVEKSEIENPLLFIINFNFEATIMSLKGTCYHVGNVISQPCILVIHLFRNINHFFMGGTITILDVLFYDNENLMTFNYNDRIKQFRFLYTALKLPKRYSINPTIFGDNNNHLDAYSIID